MAKMYFDLLAEIIEQGQRGRGHLRERSLHGIGKAVFFRGGGRGDQYLADVPTTRMILTSNHGGTAGGSGPKGNRYA